MSASSCKTRDWHLLLLFLQPTVLSVRRKKSYSSFSPLFFFAGMSKYRSSLCLSFGGGGGRDGLKRKRPSSFSSDFPFSSSSVKNRDFSHFFGATLTEKKREIDDGIVKVFSFLFPFLRRPRDQEGVVPHIVRLVCVCKHLINRGASPPPRVSRIGA